MKVVYVVCNAIGIILLWSGVGALSRKIYLLEETRKDMDMILCKLHNPNHSPDD